MGSNLNLDRPWVRGKEIILIKGSFAPNGATAVATSSFKGGHIQSVTRNSAGNWTVLLKDKLYTIESEECSIRAVDSTGRHVSFGAFSNVGTSTAVSFIIRNEVAATETDVAANADNRINFTLVARRSVLK